MMHANTKARSRFPLHRGTTRLALPDTARAGHHARVSYTSINDFGALVPGQADVAP